MNMVRASAFFAAAGILAATGMAHAAADLKITEIYIGIDAQDGTPDWAEITNFGTMTADMAGYTVNDNNGGFGTSVAIPSFNLLPGQSVVLLLEGSAGDDSIFDFIWGGGINRLLVSGSGLGLGSGGDGVYLYTSAGTLVNKVDYTGAQAGDGRQTMEILPPAFGIALSTNGVHGAYLSQGFDNDTFGTAVLTGSPGYAAPAPAAGALLGLGGLLAARRRRA